MKVRILIMGVALWISCIPTFAEVFEGTCDEHVQYSLDTETGILTLKGSGPISSSEYMVPMPWNDHKKHIKKIVADEEIVFPEFDWLSGCDSIVEPQYNATTFIYMPREYRNGNYNYGVPAGIKVIAPYAFSKCKKVWNIYINSGCEKIGTNAFSACPDLTDVHLPSTVKSIGNNAFYNCKVLCRLNMPDGIESIGSNCFRYCDALTAGVYNNHCFYYLSEKVTGEFTVPGTPKKIAPYAFAYGNLTSVVLPKSVQTIDDFAFFYNTTLTRVSFPQSLKKIGTSAFANTSLEEVTIPDGIRSISYNQFAACQSLVKVVLPETLDSICGFAFGNCSNLSEIRLPDQLKYLGTLAFENCTSLKEINIPEEVIIDGDVFTNCNGITTPLYNSHTFVKLPVSYAGEYSVPDGIRCLSDGAFANCKELTELRLPATIDRIGFGVFYNCMALEHMNLPEVIRAIPAYAFYQCHNLKDFSFPSSLKHIGEWAFVGCSSLIDLNISSAVHYIGQEAFSGCTQLATVILPEKVDTLGNAIFKDCPNLQSELILGKTYLKCPQSQGTCVVPDGIEFIGDYAFQNCEKLYSVELPESLQGIGSYAFYDCGNLKEIILPAGVDTIGVRAFEQCWSLGSMIIPEGVRNIGEGTFKNCTTLRTIQLPSRLEFMNNEIFKGCKSLTAIAIPNGVTSLSSNMFEGCASLASVTLPEGLTYIGTETFRQCTGLEKIVIPSTVENIGDRAFYGCTLLKDIALSQSLKSIESEVFYRCTSLKRITIPASVVRYDTGAFEDCSSLAYIDVEEGNPILASSSGMLCNKELTEVYEFPVCLTDLVIPSTLSGYWGYRLPDCKNLRSATLSYVGGEDYDSERYKILGAMFDRYSDNLPEETEVDADGNKWKVYRKEYKLPETLEKLVFVGDSLSMREFIYTEVDESRRVKTIYQTGGLDKIDTLQIFTDTIVGSEFLNQFKGLTVLAASHIDHLAPESFRGMEMLEHLTLSGVNVMDEGCLTDLRSLKEITLPFAGAGSISTATNFGALFDDIPNEQKKKVVQFMEDGSSKTYYLPAQLEKITLTDGCETLAYGAFYNCNMLREIVLPSSLYMVGEKAFYGCAGLTDLYCQGADPASAYSNSFEGVRVNSCKLHVPYNTSEIYRRSTGWKDFYYIEEEAPIRIEVTKNIENAGVIYGMNEYQSGDIAELKAVAHSGYLFSKWTENGHMVSEEETYTFTVESSRNLVAVFIPVSNENSVQTESGNHDVVFIWNIEEDASSYQIDIYLNEEMTELISSQKFDLNGNPIDVYNNLLKATIYGLEPSTEYYYSISAHGETGKILSVCIGSFETKQTTVMKDFPDSVDIPRVIGGTGKISVIGASGKTVEVFASSGQMLVRQVVNLDAWNIFLKPGIYLLRLDQTCVKVLVQ